MVSRRETLVAGVSAAAGIALVAQASRPLLSRARFAPLTGAGFELEALDGSKARHAVTLRDVAGTEHAFTLGFAASAGVGEGLFRVHHPDLPPVELFIAPVGPDGGRLEAVVNRSGR
ncbi:MULTISPECIES: DUF6916 family protein [Dactylosporangium]|uniref:DUF6916 domain-containing protein n=2 Tax=Dactylosporangium TaxID=35753 RepID=A0A9W6KJD5_9ACTN|nr:MULTISPECIES: hypothetical protein [Dactylosporangium]UAB94079.1 hypothetical protein Dvina_38720 [Dactylosporangium vinaceum]UWZ42490.1 hypothetical protein Dmats_33680 [Dactylosporangium matsuzakiense]GLL00594.1 hypothetical protein GCM10017581_023350 [Dactylosporangium matsuzakiense]